jgi:ATP-dependent RNA helicase DeaD
MNQALRERTIERLRKGQLDIVVATDVAARGLDVERISHVVNYDMPNDVESYVHRIGRTGRAGREGVAILFVAPREMVALRAIEKATRQAIERMSLPTREDVAGRRVARFKRKVSAVLAEQDLDFLAEVVGEIEREEETSATRVGAALAYLLQKDRPLVPEWPNEPPPRPKREEPPVRPAERPAGGERAEREERPKRSPRAERPIPPGLARYRLEVGREHGVQPKNIVGALCHEADLEGSQILNLDIRDGYSLVDLPYPFSNATFRKLQKIRISGQEAQLKLVARPEAPGSTPRAKKEGKPFYEKREGGMKPRRKG